MVREAEHLIATDYSDEMVAVTKERLKGMGNISFERADCFSLSYPDSSFNTVFMANLLHIIPEPEKAVAEGKRVLKTNGRLIIISFTTEGVNPNASRAAVSVLAGIKAEPLGTGLSADFIV